MVKDRNLYSCIESYIMSGDTKSLLGDSDTILSRRDARHLIDAYALSIDKCSKRDSPQLSVAILIPRTVHYLCAIFGCWKAGHYYIPLNMEWPEQYIREILNHLKPDVLITNLNGSWPVGHIIRTADLDQIEEVSKPTLTEWKARHEQTGLAYVIYTSGSTGAPKGVMISKRALLSYLRWIKADFRHLDKIGSLVINGEMSFDISIADIVFAVSYDMTIFITKSSRDIVSLIGMIVSRRIESIYAVPTTLLYMCRVIGSRENFKLDTVRSIFSGGEVLTPQLLINIKACFPNARIYNMYGPTETTVNCMSVRVDDISDDIVRSGEVPTGKIPKHIRWALLSQDSNHTLGEEGELIISGAQVMDGYYLESALTNEATIDICGNKYYRTGDYFKKKNDLLYYRGRNDSLVKIHGYRINTNDITAIIVKDKRILEATTCVVELDQRDELVVFYNTRDTVFNKDLVSNLKQLCLTNLPSYMVPRHFIYVDAFPRGLSGKVSKRHLTEWAIDQFRSKAVME